ncbi:P1 family peptidase [Nocardiopsis mangrovi]|uniref:P1 family peptidase n=1 Tax=Nocardiopsis mangrovi TaxID=1179818 RepID=A0ABV9DZ33_9ACTN
MAVEVGGAVALAAGDHEGGAARGTADGGAGADHAGAEGTATPGIGGNTTLTVLVTNVRLSDPSLPRMARQVHSSMHRAIQPFHTETDGDIMYALTTDEVALTGTTPTGLGTLASEVAWDAVLSCADRPHPGGVEARRGHRRPRRANRARDTTETDTKSKAKTTVATGPPRRRPPGIDVPPNHSPRDHGTNARPGRSHPRLQETTPHRAHSHHTPTR